MLHTVLPHEIGCPVEPPPGPACAPGEFPIALVAPHHGHLGGMAAGLVGSGANVRWILPDDEPHARKLADSLCNRYPDAKVARCLDEILDDPDTRLVCGADVTARRAELGIRVMEAGKDYFTDKGPMTTLAQLAAVREAVDRTGRKYYCYYCERLASECSILAGELIRQGAIGRVVHVTGMGPHRLGPPESRPDWFFRKADYGGILCDIAAHQCEQFLTYAGVETADIISARVANVAHPDFPELEDFGEASMVAPNGASFQFRVDWLTPDALHTWGDGRIFILGTEGTIELRKYIDVATDYGDNRLYLFNQKHEVNVQAKGTCGTPFFARFIRDCLDRTETAMTQAHVFAAAELGLRCQLLADQSRS